MWEASPSELLPQQKGPLCPWVCVHVAPASCSQGSARQCLAMGRWRFGFHLSWLQGTRGFRVQTMPSQARLNEIAGEDTTTTRVTPGHSISGVKARSPLALAADGIFSLLGISMLAAHRSWRGG